LAVRWNYHGFDVAQRQEAAMSLYAAIDLHSSNSVLAVMDGDGKALLQCRRPNDLPRLLADLAPYQQDLTGIAVESTYNWYWLVDGLMDHGYTVHLVNTTAIPQYDGLKHGDDHSDALHLAQLMRLGLLPEGYVYPREQRATRDLLRRRFALVRQAVRLMLSIQSSFSRSTGKQLSGSAMRQLTAAQLESLFPDLSTRFGVLIQFKLWLTLQDQITALEHWIRKDLARPDLLMRLQSVPGIGPILGMTILLESGAVERFASVGDYASYCRMVESVRLSNGKKKGHGNRRCGNRYLCWAFMEAANYAVRFHPAIRRWYERKRARKHRVVAIKAVAHKLARACYHMLHEGTSFDPARAFG
jgi:transposase